MKIVVLLALLTVPECSCITVVGQVGRSVTLPCKYDATYHGQLWTCWLRGQLPNSGCGNHLIATDPKGVINNTGASSKYQLLGRLDGGDVSLTILNVTPSDAGQYGCRVQIPGPFNDQKDQIDLKVETAVQTTTSAPTDGPTVTEHTAVNHTTAGQLTSTETHMTSSFSSVQAEQGNSRLSVALVGALFGLIVLLTVAGVVIISRRMVTLRKIPQRPQWLNHHVPSGSSSSSVLQLHRQSSAVDNIYQIDTGEDEGVYESPQ